MKIRKIKHRSPKFFGFSDEKWARGSGRWGYGRHYGKNKHGIAIDHRSKAEKQNANERSELSDRVQSILQNTTPLLEEDKKHHALLEEIYTELQKGLT